MRYPILNGWNAASMKQAILDHNNGKRAGDTFRCMYQDGTGNRCYVGCFIPAGHKALGFVLGMEALRDHFPQLVSTFPLPFDGMLELQAEHDYYFGDEDMAARALRWIDAHCYDVFD